MTIKKGGWCTMKDIFKILKFTADEDHHVVMPVRPFEEGTDPRDCTGYPMPMFFEGKPNVEINFYLECCDDDVDVNNVDDVADEMKIPASIRNDDKSAGGIDFTTKGMEIEKMEEHEALMQKRKKNYSKEIKSLACTLIPSESTSTSKSSKRTRPKSAPDKKEGKWPWIFGKSTKPQAGQKVNDESGTLAMTKTQLQSQLSQLDKTKPVIIVCHGMLSWRNQWLIANLSSQLSKSPSCNCHTLRFDFTGCGHSSGEWNYADYELDYVDLKHIIKFIQMDLKCDVACIVGHSQASAAVLRHAYEYSSCSKASPYPPLYVNLSGRCFTTNEVNYKTKFNPEQCHDLETKGRFTIVKRGPRRNFDITMDAIDHRNKYDVTHYAKGISAIHTNTSSPSSSQSKIRILTIHGDADETVPVENAYKFQQLLSSSFVINNKI